MHNKSENKEKEPISRAKKFHLSFRNWLKGFVNFRSKHSLEETVSEIIEEYNPSRHKMTKEEQNILHNFLEFGGKKVYDVMIPRADICAIKIDLSLQEITQVVVNFAHTRIIVYDRDLDDIIGFIHIKDLIPLLVSSEEFDIQNIIRKAIVVPTSKKLVDLLAQMQKQRIHIAIVLDEYGGTNGIITIEDIIEEIFGEIEDEHDADETLQYRVVNKNTIIASARMNIKNLEKLLHIKLKSVEDNFDTLGGLILSKFGHMPKKGHILDISPNIQAEVIDASARILKQIKLHINSK